MPRVRELRSERGGKATHYIAEPDCEPSARLAGLAESDIMELCGWETRSMFKRYWVKDETALASAVAKRFATGQVPAKSGFSAAPA